MRLTKEAKLVLSDYSSENSLSSDVLIELMVAHSLEDISVALQKFINIDEEKIRFIWSYVINSVWVAKDGGTIFGKGECIAFRELLNNYGCVSLKDICCVSRTPYVGRNAINNLVEIGLLDKIKLSSKEVLFVLNRSFLDEVFEK